MLLQHIHGISFVAKFQVQISGEIQTLDSKVSSIATRRLSKRDRIYLKIFPSVFLIFNLIYWTACLNISDDID